MGHNSENAESGSLLPILQSIADKATFDLAYTNARFHDLDGWKNEARGRMAALLHYPSAPCPLNAEVLERLDCGEFVREKILFDTTPDIRVPAYLLLPKSKLPNVGDGPRPAIVALHDHGGYFVYGKEKLVSLEDEHPTLTAFKTTYYTGRSVADELARRGYVVLVIDMFYWGERRMLLPDDPASWHSRDSMSEEDVMAFNRRSAERTWSIGAGLNIAGATWAGLMFHDDMRSVDYLAARPEVDANRIGCCGLSVGAYRAVYLAGLDARIKAAIVVGWMCSLPAMLGSKLTTIGPMKIVPGLHRHMDLPDVASLTCPGALMCIHGTRDRLFTNEGVQQAYRKIQAVYEKAGCPENFSGVCYDGPHEFNLQMQEKAFAWLDRHLLPG